jgi:toxin ParE1/3/4
LADVRFARTARSDIASILAASATRWGIEGRRRYQALLASAIRQLAADPNGRLTKPRTDLPGDLRSFHLRHARVSALDRVRAPVHVVYYRAIRADLIEIVAVMHDRMDPSLRFGTGDPD